MTNKKTTIGCRLSFTSVIVTGLCAALVMFVATAVLANPIDNIKALSVPGLTLAPNERQAMIANNAVRRIERTRSRTRQTGIVNTDPQAVGQSILNFLGAGNSKRRRDTRGRNPPISAAQQRNLKALAGVTQDAGGVSVRFNRKNGTPAHIKPLGRGLKIQSHSLTVDTEAPLSIARQFMADNRELLKLYFPSEEMKLSRKHRDALGKTHLRFQQMYQGVPVWGSETSVHLGRNNGVYLFHGRYEPTPKGLDNLSPTLTEDDAVLAARHHLDLPDVVIAEATAQLIVYPKEDGATILAYEVDISPSLGAVWQYFIDAHSGEVVHRIDNLQSAGTIVGASGQDLLGVTRTFNAWLEFGTYYLIDPSTPTVDPPYDPLNGINSSGDTFIRDAQNSGADNPPLFNITNGSQNGGWDSTGTSAAYNVRRTYDYFWQTFGRNSMDGAEMNLLPVIHFGINENIAFWNGQLLVFGDGDGAVFNPLVGCLDVVAHEMAHGVIEYTANLIYENQSGALNESFADIFGAMVDRDDWLIGEDCTVATPGYLRSMANPALGLDPQPAKMSEYQNLPNTEAGDYGGVHVNSGIPNRAAYLMAEGLSVEGLGTSIGRGKTEQIFYRALTNYLMQQSNFLDARRATIDSANDLYGTNSPESQAVAKAWDVVEVIEGEIGVPDDTSPTPTDPIAGEQLMVYLYPFTSVSFDVYLQRLPEPFTGYNPDLDSGPWNHLSKARETRSALVTEADGTSILYVGIDKNLYAILPDASEQQITSTGDVYSITVSPDNSYIALTGDDNNLLVIDVAAVTLASYPLVPQAIDGGGATTNTILYPDALDFDSTGQVIVFDALNCISTPTEGNCPSEGYTYWSIGLMDPKDGRQAYPFPTQSPAIDLGYPSFASNNSFVIALDIQDYSNVETNGGLVGSGVLTVNFETQEVVVIEDYGLGSTALWAVPSFWGNDDYLTVVKPSGLAHRIAIDSSWASVGASEQINDFDVAQPVMHKIGVVAFSATINASTTLLDFGNVQSGLSKASTVTISNTGDRDINITNINISGAAFTHNASNTILPRGTSMDVRVTFAAGQTAGTQVGTLALISDGDPSPLSVSLTGNVVNAGSSTDTDTVGLYDPAGSKFFLRNAHAGGVADIVYGLGMPNSGWAPITGDWDGDGTDTVGFYDPVASGFFLHNTHGSELDPSNDELFPFGPAGSGWTPLVGDWDGNGTDTVGFYSPSNSVFFLRNSNSGGLADIVYGFGPTGSGWTPLVGDWDGNGTDTVGFYSPTNSVFFLRNAHGGGSADAVYGFGPPGSGWTPITGDWDGNGTDTVGFYSSPSSVIFLRNAHGGGPADIVYGFGPPASGWTPITGDWDGS